MTSTAFENLNFEEHFDQEITVENMEKIHQLNYTLTNALQRMDKNLKSIVSVLEGGHLVSVATTEF